MQPPDYMHGHTLEEVRAFVAAGHHRKGRHRTPELKSRYRAYRHVYRDKLAPRMPSVLPDRDYPD